jgi:hypothetical protein
MLFCYFNYFLCKVDRIYSITTSTRLLEILFEDEINQPPFFLPIFLKLVNVFFDMLVMNVYLRKRVVRIFVIRN